MPFPENSPLVPSSSSSLSKAVLSHLSCPAQWHQLGTLAPRSRTRASGASEPRGPESPSASDPPGPRVKMQDGEAAQPQPAHSIMGSGSRARQRWGGCGHLGRAPSTVSHVPVTPASCTQLLSLGAAIPASLLLWFPTLPGEHGRPLGSHTVAGTEPGGSGDHSTQRLGSVLCGHSGPGQPQSAPAHRALRSQGPGASAWATRDPRRSLGQSSGHFPSASSGPRPPWKTR